MPSPDTEALVTVIGQLAWCVTFSAITIAISIISAAQTIKYAILRHSLTHR